MDDNYIGRITIQKEKVCAAQIDFVWGYSKLPAQLAHIPL